MLQSQSSGEKLTVTIKIELVDHYNQTVKIHYEE